MRQRLVRRTLAARGMVEAVTWSFVPLAEAKLFGGGQPALTLDNPISTELAQMRPSLLPGLITAAKRNRDRGFADGALFELGQAYRGAAPEDQYVAATGVRFGQSALAGSGRHWSGAAPAADWAAVKADAIAALAALGLGQSQYPSDPRGARPGSIRDVRARSSSGPRSRSACSASCIPIRLQALGADAPMAAFELYLDALPASKRKSTARPALQASDLQSVRRDFAFLVDARRGCGRRGACGGRAPTGRSSPRSACSTSSPAKACPTVRSRWRSR